ncbi:hypothetical protein [Bacillus sp. NH11B]|uniref:hypothetical protein n=1 Tax=Bacillus sp. NH11B TaxID=1866314 RepID=UPI0008FDBE66|nr:hypothetical protein [Bacillus sp. NH11B]OJD64772.1 hypothetical protein BAU27_05065 [Bacillus sp. NH11B]
MKFTLFTISNEQIKEQLSKLQTKVESLETVKDVQDKIISAKDSQITFLQGEISSISNWVIGGTGVIIALASAAFIYIKLLENKAKKKIADGETQINLATQKIAEAETKLQQADQKLEEVDNKIKQINNINAIAEEKINKMNYKQKLEVKFNTIKTRLENLNANQASFQETIPAKDQDAFNKLVKKRKNLEQHYRILYSDLSDRILFEEEITSDILRMIEKLNDDSLSLAEEFVSLVVI